ncbi:MAG: hypothetical protein ACRCUT_10385 [Spirochaetota bacterium]
MGASWRAPYEHFLQDCGIPGLPLRRADNSVSPECGFIRLFSFRSDFDIVIIPVPGSDPSAWPVAWLNCASGAGTVFSCSVTKWFPSFLIFIRSFEGISPVLRACRREILSYAQPFGADTEKITELILDENSYTYDRDLYALSEPESFLHRFNVIIHEEDDDGEMKDLFSLRRQYPFYNRPLRVFMDDDIWNEQIADDILSCRMRWDLYDDPADTLGAVFGWMSGFHHPADSPIRVLSPLASGNFPRSADLFLEMGDLFEQQGDSFLALNAWDNALLCRHRFGGGAQGGAEERIAACWKRLHESAQKGERI